MKRLAAAALLLTACGVKSAPRPPGVPEPPRAKACADCTVPDEGPGFPPAGEGGAGGDDYNPIIGD